MSFRSRLTLFFVVIVILPMIAVTLLLFRLISDSEHGKADAGVAAAERAATGLYRLDASGARARRAILAVQSDRKLARALAHGDAALAQRRATALVATGRIVRLQVSKAGRVLADAGAADAVAPVPRDLVSPHGAALGRLELSIHDAAGYAALVHRISGADVIVSRGSRVLATTLVGARSGLPAVGDVDIGGRGFRVASFDAGDTLAAQPLRISVLRPSGSTGSAISSSRLVAGVVLAGFFALAIAFALLVSRSLQQQIASFLEAARRLGGGDFSGRVPVVGGDEFAALGAEFNRMSEQLEARLEELRRQRARLEQSLERIGETFAANLDRDALLGIVLRTAVDGVGAQGGRATIRDDGADRLREAARVGDLGSLRDALQAAESGALGSRQSIAETVDDVHALARSLVTADDSDAVVGMISVARPGRAFEPAEIDLFDYLARQATVSVENVGLHEQVQREAVTDELTGLSNHRRFQEALEAEIERSRRFEQPVGLVMLDLDNFKQINDTRGHPQGDEVLRAVADLLREHSREIDVPARYGGEELALVLPGTDLEGAYQLAERLREGIEEREIALINGEGTMRITASLGVASFPGSADDRAGLIARADAALYEAKGGGKNKSVRASVGLGRDGTARRGDPRAS